MAANFYTLDRILTENYRAYDNLVFGWTQSKWAVPLQHTRSPQRDWLRQHYPQLGKENTNHIIREINAYRRRERHAYHLETKAERRRELYRQKKDDEKYQRLEQEKRDKIQRAGYNSYAAYDAAVAAGLVQE